MGKLKSVFIFTALLSMFLSAQTGFAATDDRFGILYGVDHAFQFEAPEGWVLDNQVAASKGLYAVFYPKGQTWAMSPVVAYARARSKDSALVTIDYIVNETLKDFRQDSPHINATPAGTVSLKDGRKGKVYHYTGDRWGNYEAAVYFEEKKTVNFFVLSAHNEDAFKESLAAFEQLAKSYKFMGDAPIIEKNKEVDVKGPPELFEITTACDSKKLAAIEAALGKGEEQIVTYDYTLYLLFKNNELKDISITGGDFTDEVRRCIIGKFKQTFKYTAPAKGVVPIEVSFPAKITPKNVGAGQ